MCTSAQRMKMVSISNMLVANRALIRYDMVRPMATRVYTLATLEARFKQHGVIAMDCSESVTLICRLAGLKDPNGLNYNGDGNTQTLYDHLPHYTRIGQAGAGSLCVFGEAAGPNSHVVMVMTPSKTDPIVFSHGGNAGPTKMPLSWLRAGFVGKPMTFLEIAHL